MTQFIDILSPNVVKAKHVDTIPEKLHGRYLLLVNLLHLTSPTLYQAPSYDDYTGSGSYEPLDSSIPAIYVDITDKFVRRHMVGQTVINLQPYVDQSDDNLNCLRNDRRDRQIFFSHNRSSFPLFLNSITQLFVQCLLNFNLLVL